MTRCDNVRGTELLTDKSISQERDATLYSYSYSKTNKGNGIIEERASADGASGMAASSSHDLAAAAAAAVSKNRTQRSFSSEDKNSPSATNPGIII